MTRLAHVILMLYPRTWRARYEDEMAATLGECNPTLGTYLDLVRGAIDAWGHLNCSGRRQATLDTSQSRFVLKSCISIAVIAQVAALAGNLQIIFPDIPNNTSWIWLVGDALLCALIGAYVAARRRRLPVATLAGAVAGICATALLMVMQLAVFITLTWLRFPGFEHEPSTLSLTITWLAAGLIPVAVGVCAGAALGSAGWVALKLAWRPAARALAVLLSNIAAASQASAKALAHVAAPTE